MKEEEEARLKAEQEAEEEQKDKKKGKKDKKKKGDMQEDDLKDEFEEPYVDLKEERQKLFIELVVPVDPEGNQCVMPKPLFEHSYIRDFLASLRERVFNYIKSLSDDIKKDEINRDKEFIENSLLILD